MTRGDEKAGSALTERHRRTRDTHRVVCLERRLSGGLMRAGSEDGRSVKQGGR